MKKILIAITVFSLLPVSALAVAFSDVPSNAWFAASVQQAADLGIVSGYADVNGNATGKFGPANSVTLAEALKMSLTSAGYDLIDYPELTSGMTHWAKRYLSFATANNFGIFVGVFENVDAPATRLEAARIVADSFGLDKANEYPSTPVLIDPYIDVDAKKYNQGYGGDIWTYAILKLSSDGILTGDTDAQGKPTGHFRPNDQINRAEMVKIVLAARQKYGEPGTTSSASSSSSAPSGSLSWYTNQKDGYVLQYPSSWKVQESVPPPDTSVFSNLGTMIGVPNVGNSEYVFASVLPACPDLSQLEPTPVPAPSTTTSIDDKQFLMESAADGAAGSVGESTYYSWKQDDSHCFVLMSFTFHITGDALDEPARSQEKQKIAGIHLTLDAIMHSFHVTGK